MITHLEKKVALRYLSTRKKDGFLNIITIFSFTGISLGVAAIIIVMSVMNGFREELTSKILGINGHLKIKSSFGNALKNNSEFPEKIVDIDKNLIIHKVVTSQGLLTFKKYSSGVLIKGVTENFF